MNNNSNKLQRFHSLMMNFDLGLFTTVFLPFALLIEQFIKPPKRSAFWRSVAIWIIKTVFNLNNVKIITKNIHNVISPAIYAANHPSHMDGFVILTILGTNTILFTAPLQQFPRILAIWLKKMEAIDVRRDPVDDEA